MADASIALCTKTCISCGLTKPIDDFAKHKTSKDGRRGNCKLCRTKYEKKWLKDNLTIRKATNRKSARKYRQNNKEKIAERDKIYYEKNKDVFISRDRAKYKAENRDKYRLYDTVRRSRKCNSNGNHTCKEIRNLHEKQNFKCANCKTSIKKKYHLDHILPLSKGGSNYIENIQLLCPSCNLRKSARCPFRWANMNGRLL